MTVTLNLSLLNKKKPNFRPLMTAVFTSLVLSACQPANDATQDTIDNTAPDVEAVVVEETAAEKTITPPVSHETSESIESTKATNAPTQMIEQPITILALGDSLTEGLGVPANDTYPAQLQQALNEAGYVNTRVINSGLSGETSTGLMNRLDWVLKTNPDITILTTGANDAMRGIDVTTVETNIRTAIQRLQDNGSVVILGGMQIYDNMGDEYVKSFSNIYPKIAEDTGVAFIPFFLEGVAGEKTLNQSDAIHPTKEGYTSIVNNNILPVLEPTLAKYVADSRDSTDKVNRTDSTDSTATKTETAQ